MVAFIDNEKAKNMKNIIVPTDFSIPADNATHYAVDLARVFGSSIILYHTFIPFESSFYSYNLRKMENLETENNLQIRLTKIRDRILKTNQNIDVSVHVDRGSGSTRLIKFCRDKKADLIVMGTTGASGFKEVLIGSFTSDTITKAICPILAIPGKYKFRFPKKITFATNYLNKDIQSFKYLLNWNQPFKAKINILHIDKWEINPALEEAMFLKYKRKIEMEFKDIPFYFQHVEGEDIPKAISHITLNDKTDVLVISPVRRTGFWTKLFYKSTTKTSMHHIRIPILAIPVQ